MLEWYWEEPENAWRDSKCDYHAAQNKCVNTKDHCRLPTIFELIFERVQRQSENICENPFSMIYRSDSTDDLPLTCTYWSASPVAAEKNVHWVLTEQGNWKEKNDSLPANCCCVRTSEYTAKTNQDEPVSKQDIIEFHRELWAIIHAKKKGIELVREYIQIANSGGLESEQQLANAAIVETVFIAPDRHKLASHKVFSRIDPRLFSVI